MPLPARLRNKLLNRFDELIAEGDAIHSAIKFVPGVFHAVYFPRGAMRQGPDQHIVDWPRFVQWRENSVSLLDQVVPKSSAHRTAINTFQGLENSKSHLEFGVAKLKALRHDFEKDFLDDLAVQVEGELAADYLGQAESLLGEGQRAMMGHVPAAVLSGAILERGLRTICGVQVPAIQAVDGDGRPLMLNRLIDTMKAAGIFNELMAKQLRAWADIRNAAAHGEFDKFSRSDVETMLAGVKGFLAQYHP